MKLLAWLVAFVVPPLASTMAGASRAGTALAGGLWLAGLAAFFGFMVIVGATLMIAGTLVALSHVVRGPR